jgi:polysaccharide deacetylase 2 family uncharacterized protein YibQ
MPKRKTSPRPASRRLRPWLAGLGAQLVLVVAGLGLLHWSETPVGRAVLLARGFERFRPGVLAAVDAALPGALPAYVTGPAAADAAGDPDPARFDWRETPDGPEIRCRVSEAPEGLSLWQVQAAVAEAVAEVGAGVLWGERLQRPRPRWRAAPEGESGDLLRLDLGLPGRPTHTLLIHPAGTTPPAVHWADRAAEVRPSELLGPLDTPTVAIVIDDWGNSFNETTRALLRLDVPLTLSILPGLPFSRQTALKATTLALPATLDDASGLREERLALGCPVGLSLEAAVGTTPPPRRRREVMLHLPMEPRGYPAVNPGKDPLLVGMDRHRMAAILDAALVNLPGVAGLNNHMGSAATADRATMDALMPLLAERGLFFLDSMTINTSTAAQAAAAAGVPVLKNRIFLDQSTTSREEVRSLLARLVRAARSTGSAVGICHPYPETLDVLRQELPRYGADGVRFVTVSELLALREEARHVAEAGS